MPELPEVETTRRGILPVLLERSVTGMIVRESRLRWPIAPELPAWVTGQRVRDVSRRAKYLLIRFDSGSLILHLGMSGSLRILPAGTPALRHDHFDLLLDSGACLRFNDPRRFGSLHWTTEPPASHPLLAHLGVEPLEASFDAAYLTAAASGRRAPIKALIMDGRVVAGVGNIYASESLFRAGIHPGRAAGRISAHRLGRLVDAIREVLGAAIREGGTTLRDYVNAEGTPGYFRQQLYVYERTGAPCRICRSSIRHAVHGQRSTYYCPRCQR